MQRHPFDRLTSPITLPYQLQRGRDRPRLGMTVYTNLGRGNTGERRRLHRLVAVPAVQPQTSGVVFVAERDIVFALGWK
jgi:hypothetical protein